MHITYDLPVAIDDIIEAKQRLAGRIYKQVCLAPTILVNVAKVKYSSNSKTCSVLVHLKFVAHLIN
ncbi:catabolic threonine dehydratase [Escherichia coli]|nr:catabolic threonine dehydratase [Escherichia coli]